MRSIGLPEMLVISGVFVIIPLAAIFVVYLVRSLQAKERLQAIAKGVTVPVAPADPWERAARTREGGIILVAIGLGLFTLLATTVGADGRGPLIGVGVGAIPFFMGVGLLLAYRLRVRDLKAGRPPQSPDGNVREA